MSDEPVNRRKFFRQGLFELLKPLAQTVRPLTDMAQELQKLEAPPKRTGQASSSPRPLPPGVQPTRRALPNPVLRPPGAIDEPGFTSACTLCDKCVEVCPAEAIKIDPSGVHGGGLPYIDPDAMACVACEGLHCMAACPTGALLPIPLVEIDMGTAHWRPSSCLRAQGEDCTICIDVCPIGSAAIELADNQILVKEESCIGCGLCQNRCPTEPASIVVIPS